MTTLKPIYKLSELAQLMDLDRRAVANILEARGVQTRWQGKEGRGGVKVVFLSDIKDQAPELFSAINVARAMSGLLGDEAG